MSQRRSPHPEAGLGQLGGALMIATHSGQSVKRNLGRPRYAPTPQPQRKPQPQAQKQVRTQPQPQPHYQPSPTDIFNVRLAMLTSKKIPVNLPRRQG